MWLNQIVIINQPQKYGQKINSWISAMELWQGLLICPIIKLLILPIPPTLRMLYAINKSWSERNCLKLSGGRITGQLYLPYSNCVTQNQALNSHTGNNFFVQNYNPYCYKRMNMVNHKIIDLGDPADATDAVNLKTLNTHYKNI